MFQSTAPLFAQYDQDRASADPARRDNAWRLMLAAAQLQAGDIEDAADTLESWFRFSQVIPSYPKV